jgi:hypothetical protein
MTSPPTRAAIEAATKVLAKAALLDPRISTGDEGTILAWAEVLGSSANYPDDLLAAVVDHYRSTDARIMPADVLRLARIRCNDRINRTIGNDTAPPAPPLAPATVEARRQAIAAAVAKIGAEHDPDTRREFETAPTPPKPVSQATIAAKVERVRAAAPPTPLPPDDVVDAEIYCGMQSTEGLDCQLVHGHDGGHHYGETLPCGHQRAYYGAAFFGGTGCVENCQPADNEAGA